MLQTDGVGDFIEIQIEGLKISLNEKLERDLTWILLKGRLYEEIGSYKGF